MSNFVKTVIVSVLIFGFSWFVVAAGTAFVHAVNP